MFGKTTLDTKLAEHLAKVGACFRRDLVMYGMLHASERRVQKVIQERIEQGYFKVSGVAKSKKNKTDDEYEYISLTKQGKVAYLDAIEEDEDYYRTFFEEKDALFRTINTENLRVALRTARAESMFAANGVKFAQVDKPSLLYLFGKMTDAPSVYVNETYNDTLLRIECEELLKEGLFYTIKEVRDFLDATGGESDDTHLSRARGIFISLDKILVVYIPETGNNKLIRVVKVAEKRLLMKLDIFKKITNAFRRLPDLSKKRKNPATGEYVVTNMLESKPYALVISDGDSMVYSMAMGNPNGLIKGVDVSQIENAFRRGNNNGLNEMAKERLKANGDIFTRIFVTPNTLNGIGSLGYLCHTSAEEWLVASKYLFGKSDKFTVGNYDPIYPAKEKGEWSSSAIFMPVFEVNELYKISQDKFPTTILTYHDMLDAISHSVRRVLSYYNADTMEKFDDDEVRIYDENGYPMGYHMFEERLKQKGLTCLRKDLNNLPALNGYTQIRFYNEVARGNIDIDPLIKTLPCERLPEKQENKATRTKGTSLRYSETFKNDLKKTAKLYDKSVNALIRDQIYDFVTEGAKLYDEKKKKSRKDFKKDRI